MSLQGIELKEVEDFELKNQKIIDVERLAANVLILELESGRKIRVVAAQHYHGRGEVKLKKG